MLILDGTIGSDISAFLARLQEEVLPCKIMLYAEWLATYASHLCSETHDPSTPSTELRIDSALLCPPKLSAKDGAKEDHHPEGIIYIRVMPEIALKRLQQRSLQEESISLEYIYQVYQQKNEQFIENKNNPTALQNLPVLVLNGNIDFQADFSQFYSHLFYIKRFLLQIQERKEVAMGIYKEKAYRRCC